MAIRIVCGDCIATPAGNSDTKVFDVVRARGEVDAINERVNDRPRAKGNAGVCQEENIRNRRRRTLQAGLQEGW